MMPPPPPRQPYLNPNMSPNQVHYQQNYNAQPYSQPPHPYNPQYPGYNHYRPPNVPYNYDANNAPNWNDRKFTFFFLN